MTTPSSGGNAPLESQGPATGVAAVTAGSPLREGDVVWCVFADGVLGGLYAGTKTFPTKTEGKPDLVCHYVQLAGRDYAQYVNPEHIYSDMLEARAAFRKYAAAQVAHLKSVAGLYEENDADQPRPTNGE